MNVELLGLSFETGRRSEFMILTTLSRIKLEYWFIDFSDGTLRSVLSNGQQPVVNYENIFSCASSPNENSNASLPI